MSELVIAWLNGELAETPCHGAGPWDETITLLPQLAALNRAGFVTTNSQLAETAGGDSWNTYVDGFASGQTLTRVRAVARGTSLKVTACRGREHGKRHGLGTWWTCPAPQTLSFWAGLCPRTAAELRSCWYVRAEDPRPGRNDLLWPALARIQDG